MVRTSQQATVTQKAEKVDAGSDKRCQNTQPGMGAHADPSALPKAFIPSISQMFIVCKPARFSLYTFGQLIDTPEFSDFGG